MRNAKRGRRFRNSFKRFGQLPAEFTPDAEVVSQRREEDAHSGADDPSEHTDEVQKRRKYANNRADAVDDACDMVGHEMFYPRQMGEPSSEVVHAYDQGYEQYPDAIAFQPPALFFAKRQTDQGDHQAQNEQGDNGVQVFIHRFVPQRSWFFGEESFPTVRVILYHF